MKPPSAVNRLGRPIRRVTTSKNRRFSGFLCLVTCGTTVIKLVRVLRNPLSPPISRLFCRRRVGPMARPKVLRAGGASYRL